MVVVGPGSSIKFFFHLTSGLISISRSKPVLSDSNNVRVKIVILAAFSQENISDSKIIYEVTEVNDGL